MKPKVLLLCDYFLPGYKAGGPIRTLQALIERLHTSCQFTVLTRNHDLGSGTPYTEQELKDVEVSGVNKTYLKSLAAPFACRRLIRTGDFEIIFLNSLFSPYFSLLPLLIVKLLMRAKVKIILAPRGECAPEALLHHRLRKSIYLFLAKQLRLFNGVTWLASSTREEVQIQNLLVPMGHLQPKIVRIPEAHSIHSSPSYERPKKTAGRLKMVYLSRIHPIKGLEFLLSVLETLSTSIELDIYGPVDPGQSEYWLSCQSKILRLNAKHKIKYHGPIEAARVDQTLTQYDMYVLPTKSENFGHSILEALNAGTPVLISDQTPWSAVSALGAGWALPLNSELFKDALTSAITENAEQWQIRQNAALQMAQEHLKFDQKKWLDLFQ